MNKLILTFVLCLLGVVFAETIIEEIEEKTAQDAQEDLKIKPRQVKKLTKEEKAIKIKEKKEKTQKLEGCLVMTRAFYQQNEQKYTAYIQQHATVAPFLDNEQLYKQNSNMLLSKMNAQMLIQCDKKITKDQIKTLQKFKFKPASFKNYGIEYQNLVDVDFQQFDMAQNDENGEPAKLQFTPQENMMLS